MSGGIAGRQPLADRMSDRARQAPRGLSARRVVGVHDGDDSVVEAAPGAHQYVLKMEKPVAETGAAVAGRAAIASGADQCRVLPVGPPGREQRAASAVQAARSRPSAVKLKTMLPGSIPVMLS